MVRAIRQAFLLSIMSSVLVGALPATIFGNCLAAIKCESECPQHASPEPAVPSCCQESAPEAKKEPATHICECFKAEAGSKALPGQFAPTFDFPIVEAARSDTAVTAEFREATVPVGVRNHGPPRLIPIGSQGSRAPPIA